jgi:PAS domain-containing protein
VLGGRVIGPGRSPVVLAAVVVAVAVAVSCEVSAVLAAGQRDAAAHQFDGRVRLVAEAVANEVGRYEDTLRTVAAAVGGAGPLTAAEFVEVATPLAEMRLAGATSIAFLVPAADAEIATVQQTWRTNGVPDLVLNPQGTGHEHIFTVMIHPLDGSTAARPGVDVTQVPAPTQALTEARRSGRVTVSDAYQLIIDRHLPAAQRQMSFTLTAPVYGAADAGGNRPFRGWVLMGMRGQDFIGTTLAHISQDLVDVTLRAQNTDHTTVPVATLRAAATGRRDRSHTVDVMVAERVWQLHIQANGRRLPGGSGALPTVVAIAGSALGLLLAGLVYVLATGRARAQAKVRAATAELAGVAAHAGEQADLLAAIMDSISDGVGVVDPQGEFMLLNPAAEAILGPPAGGGGPERWQAHYGIHLPDGVTAFPTADLPLVRALSGESTEQVEMFIRNAVRPDGVSITVSGRPLITRDGQAGAVAVFHDITDRKAAEAQLRAARDELADQRTYLTQILDAIDIAVVTCDATGAIVHANQAARDWTRTFARPVTVTETAVRVGVAALDGSAVAEQDLPLLRALTGEEIRGHEMILNPPGKPRRSILVDARPLRDAAGRIVGAVTSSYDITVLHQREADLRALASIDALTGLPNRRAWTVELPIALERARRDRVPLSIAMIDLDHFKRFNDEFGHPAGDRLLKGVAAAWKEQIRAVDLLARYAGEEAAPGDPVRADVLRRRGRVERHRELRRAGRPRRQGAVPRQADRP